MLPAHLDIFKLQAADQTETIHKHGHKRCLLLVPSLPAALKVFCQLDGQFRGCLVRGEVGGGVRLAMTHRMPSPTVKDCDSFMKTFHWCL